MCSTPFGIKEGCAPTTRSRAVSTWCAQRLSASKRAARAEAVEDSSTIFHVLNAFRHQRGLRWRPTGEVSLLASGAQRLSASKRAAQGVVVGGVWLYRVLNAFRHQRGLRRRGAWAAKPIARAHAFRQCSTPFGIKEGCARKPTIPSVPVDVLNAFRHQRGLRSTRVTICFLKTNIPVCHVLLRICYMSPSHYTSQRKKC